ncbi:MAG: HD domain-containing protein [Firmicutes bacterium]|nr:HD domain-containing protein [Bacillota bacterium]
MTKQITLEQIKNCEEIKALIAAANDNLAHKGYTEHGLRHTGFVSCTTANMLEELGYDKRMVELGAMAGWMHDIGNAVNRYNHGPTGAAIVFAVLQKLDMSIHEIITIIGAIGNHEEQTGIPVNPVSAAMIIADKSDAHKTRVRKYSKRLGSGDIHDRVNLSIKDNRVTVDAKNKIIRLCISMDETSAPMEYLQIYMSRMVMCESAATFLGCLFELVINGVVINHHKPAPKNVDALVKGKEVSEEI